IFSLSLGSSLAGLSAASNIPTVSTRSIPFIAVLRKEVVRSLESRGSLLSGCALLQDDLHLQHRLAELQGVVGLDRDALALGDEDAVHRCHAPAGVGDAQAALVEPDEREAVDLHCYSRVLLFRQVHIHCGWALTPNVRHAFLQAVALAGSKPLGHRQLDLRSF